MGRGHAYTPKKTRGYEALIKSLTAKKYTAKPLTGDLFIVIVFSFKKAKTGQLRYPHYDIDNLVKSYLDATQGVLFENDNQIVGMQAMKVYGDDSIIVEIGEVKAYGKLSKMQK